MTSESRAWERPDGTPPADVLATELQRVEAAGWDNDPVRVLSGVRLRGENDWLTTAEFACNLLDRLDAAAPVATGQAVPRNVFEGRARDVARALGDAVEDDDVPRWYDVMERVRKLARRTTEPNPSDPSDGSGVDNTTRVNAVDTQSAAPTRAALIHAAAKRASTLPGIDDAPVSRVIEETVTAVLGVLRGGGADGGGEDEDGEQKPLSEVRNPQLIPTMWYSPSRAVLGSSRTDGLVVQRDGDPSRLYGYSARALGWCLLDRLLPDDAILLVGHGDYVAVNDIRRLATAAGVSPDSEDVVGEIEAAIRAGRAGHEDLFAAEADYWQKRHGAVAGRVRAAVKALSGGGEHYLMESGLESRPEPPVETTFTNPETGEIAWQRQPDGWHCTRADCWNCPAGWDEVCDWGGGVDGLVRHLPEVRVGTGGGETGEQ